MQTGRSRRSLGIGNNRSISHIDGILAHLGRLHGCLDAEDGVDPTVDFEFQGLETGYGFPGTVIDLGLGIRSEGDLVLVNAIGNVNFPNWVLMSQLLGSVPSLVGPLIEIEGKGIIGRADELLRTAEGATYAITSSKILITHGGIYDTK